MSLVTVAVPPPSSVLRFVTPLTVSNDQQTGGMVKRGRMYPYLQS